MYNGINNLPLRLLIAVWLPKIGPIPFVNILVDSGQTNQTVSFFFKPTKSLHYVINSQNISYYIWLTKRQKKKKITKNGYTV